MISCPCTTIPRTLPLQNEILKERLGRCPEVAAIASEEEDGVVALAPEAGSLIVVFDPLDGSRNIDAAIPTGDGPQLRPRVVNAEGRGERRGAWSAQRGAGSAQRGVVSAEGRVVSAEGRGQRRGACAQRRGAWSAQRAGGRCSNPGGPGRQLIDAPASRISLVIGFRP